MNDEFFKLYPEYKDKCPFPMDLVKMYAKNEDLLYGVDLTSIVTDCQVRIEEERSDELTTLAKGCSEATATYHSTPIKAFHSSLRSSPSFSPFVAIPFAHRS